MGLHVKSTNRDITVHSHSSLFSSKTTIVSSWLIGTNESGTLRWADGGLPPTMRRFIMRPRRTHELEMTLHKGPEDGSIA